MSSIPTIFHNADAEPIPYDGSPLTWRVSAYVLIRKDDTVLLGKNKVEKLYDIPGGGLEFGESIEEALKREAREEAGVEIQLGQLVYVGEGFFYKQVEKRFHQTIQLFYVGELIGELGEPQDPTTEWRGFVSLAELEKYPLPGNVSEAMKAAGFIT